MLTLRIFEHKSIMIITFALIILVTNNMFFINILSISWIVCCKRRKRKNIKNYIWILITNIYSLPFYLCPGGIILLYCLNRKEHMEQAPAMIVLPGNIKTKKKSWNTLTLLVPGGEASQAPPYIKSRCLPP